jgi:hypothetical protein
MVDIVPKRREVEPATKGHGVEVVVDIEAFLFSLESPVRQQICPRTIFHFADGGSRRAKQEWGLPRRLGAGILWRKRAGLVSANSFSHPACFLC